MDNTAPCKVYTRNSFDTKLCESKFFKRSEKSGIVGIISKESDVSKQELLLQQPKSFVFQSPPNRKELFLSSNRSRSEAKARLED